MAFRKRAISHPSSVLQLAVPSAHQPSVTFQYSRTLRYGLL